MEKGLKDSLRKNRSFLKSNVTDVGAVLDHLYSEGVLTENLKESISKEHDIDSKRVLALLDVIPKRGQRAYQCLIEALQETENFDAAQCLIDAKDGVVPTSTSQYSEQPKIQIKTSKDKEVATEKPKNSNQESAKQEKEQNETKDLEEHWLESGKEMSGRELKKCTQQFYIDRKKEGRSYDMIRKNRGHMLMIINVPTGLKGITRDLETSRVSGLFGQLGFKTYSAIRDCSASDMQGKLGTKLKGVNFEDAPYCVVVALTVGPDSDKIYGNQGDDDFLLPSKLIGMMQGIEKLNGKPKLLIYQTIPKDTEFVGSIPCTGDRNEHPLEECQEYNNDDSFIVTATPRNGCHPVVQGFQYGKEERDREGKGTYFLVALLHTLKHFAAEKSFKELIEETHNLLTDTFYVPSSPSGDTVDSAPSPNKADASSEPDERKRTEIGRRMQVASVKIETTCKNKDLYFFPGIKEGSLNQQATS